MALTAYNVSHKEIRKLRAASGFWVPGVFYCLIFPKIDVAFCRIVFSFTEVRRMGHHIQAISCQADQGNFWCKLLIRGTSSFHGCGPETGEDAGRKRGDLDGPTGDGECLLQVGNFFSSHSVCHGCVFFYTLCPPTPML